MDEATWNSCTDPQKMLQFLKGKASNRKLRLFACACCRRIWDLLIDERSRNAVATAEHYADGLVRRKEMKARRREALANVTDSVRHPAAFAASSTARPRLAPAWVAYLVHCAKAFDRDAPHGRESEHTEQAVLLRDLIGNPFGPVFISAPILTWRDATVPKLAQAAYERRELPSGHLDPSLLAVLADALEEAGCTDAEILGHLRGPGPHLRGCYVIDLLTGRK